MQLFNDVLQQIKDTKKNLEFIKTGFKTLDDWLDGGFMKKELIIIGAYTGLGKSYVAGQFFYNAVCQGFTCAYFSLEISNMLIVARMIGSLSNLKPTRLIGGFLTPNEFDSKLEAEAKLNAMEKQMYFFDDLYELDKIEKAIKEHKFDFVVVDFIQNVFARGNEEYSRLSYVALQLQKIAKENNCCILVLSQLSNLMAKEMGKSPIYEYKGSGAIATVCDLGFFLRRPEVITKDVSENQIDLDLKKNRRGLSGKTFSLLFRHPGGWIYEKPTQTVDY